MIPIFDAKAQYAQIKGEVDPAVAEVLASGWYIHGAQHRAFEEEFARYCEVEHAVGVANGTEAITIALLALGVEPGDEVITVANAGVPPVAAIVEASATPVFVDVDAAARDLDPAQLARLITRRTRAIVAVHLYGMPVDVDAIRAAIGDRPIALVEDCAQAHGARYKGRRVGSLGDAAAFSFYPTKNLGAYGDGGCVTTNDAAVADRARYLRMYGWRARYTSEFHGRNSRLDEIQAAILRVKLRHLEAWNEQRRTIAEHYRERLRGVEIPSVFADREPVYHLFVVESDRRDAIRQGLAEQGIGSDLHYPIASHMQQAYERFGNGAGSLPVTERLTRRVLSLPIYPELSLEMVDRVAEAVSELAR